MSNVEIITQSDFSLEPSDDGKQKLRINLPGCYAVLVMSSAKDEGLRVKQILNNMRIQGLGKAYIDIMQGKNRILPKMSMQSTTPIRHVPVLYLVVDGKIRGNYNKQTDPRQIEGWFREKFQKFGAMAAQGQGAPRRNGMRKPEHMATMYAEDPRVSGRRRRGGGNFSMAEQQDREIQQQRTVGAPTGINAAWRVDMDEV